MTLTLIHIVMAVHSGLFYFVTSPGRAFAACALSPPGRGPLALQREGVGEGARIHQYLR
jgi:hypothetical protein